MSVTTIDSAYLNKLLRDEYARKDFIANHLCDDEDIHKVICETARVLLDREWHERNKSLHNKFIGESFINLFRKVLHDAATLESE